MLLGQGDREFHFYLTMASPSGHASTCMPMLSLKHDCRHLALQEASITYKFKMRGKSHHARRRVDQPLPLQAAPCMAPQHLGMRLLITLLAQCAGTEWYVSSSTHEGWTTTHSMLGTHVNKGRCQWHWGPNEGRHPWVGVRLLREAQPALRAQLGMDPQAPTHGSIWPTRFVGLGFEEADHSVCTSQHARGHAMPCHP